MSKDRQSLTDGVLELLHSIAPEIEIRQLDLNKPLRQQVDLDSMDWLNFLLGIHQRFGLTVAESDYTRLVCMNDVLDYIQTRSH